jgi:hypothetical protein
MADIQCVFCDSSEVRTHRQRIRKDTTRSTQYQCSDCKGYFTADAGTSGGIWKAAGESGNTAMVAGTIAYPSERPAPTLKEVLTKFAIDEKIWSVERFTVNQWEQAQAGKNDQPTILALYQVKLTLVRLVARTTALPSLKPIALNIGKSKMAKPSGNGRKKAVYVSDSHIGFHRALDSGKLKPFHDRLHWSALLSYLSKNTVDLVVLGGDMLDMADMSDKFAQTPEGYFTTQPALLELAWLIGQIMKVTPDTTKIVYIEGNHENRLPRFMLSHFSSAYGVDSINFKGEPVLSVPQIIATHGVDTDRFVWVGDYPNGEYWLNEHTRFIHGNVSKARPGATGAAYLEAISASTIFGHIHRREVASTTHHFRQDGNSQSIAYTAETFGMFGVPSQVPPFKMTHNWSQGFGLISYDETTYSAQHIALEPGGFTVSDKFYAGMDYTHQLAKDTKWSALSLQ